MIQDIWNRINASDLESGVYEYVEEYDRLLDAEELRRIRHDTLIVEAQTREYLRQMGLEP